MEIYEHYLVEHQNKFIVSEVSKQIQDDQYKLLELLVSSCAHPNMNCVEIGSWTGNSAVLIGTIVKRMCGKLYSIDWYQGGVGEEHLKSLAEKINIRDIFMSNMKFFELEDTVTQMNTKSEAANKDFDKESLDFIFIDGDHTYEGVKEDIKLWLPKLKRGKILAGHDYNHTGVNKAVNEIFPLAEKMKELWWIKKP